MHMRDEPALRSSGMRRHHLGSLNFHAMDWPSAILRIATKFSVVVSIVSPGLRVRRISRRTVRILFQLRQRSFRRPGRFQRLARHRINVITPSNERHIASHFMNVKEIAKE
jgi:hypothetical protein